MASYDENGGDDFTKTGNVTIGSIAGDESRQGTDHEHRLSFLEAIKLYPSAVGWTIYFSLGVRCCQIILQFTSLMLTQVAHRLSWQGPFVHHTSHLKIDMQGLTI
jgi:hypothetical protein